MADLLAEANVRDLLVEYWTELSPVKDAAPLNPDFARMLALEEAGIRRFWACRVDGTLAGFICWDITEHLNYKGTPFAIDAGHYLSPAFRDKGRIGYRMWRSSIAALKALGVRVALAHDNAGSLVPFFLALGFEPRSVVYWRDLSE